MKKASRLVWFIFTTVLVCAILGGIYGRRVEATGNAPKDADVKASLQTFSKVYSLVQQDYADPVKPDRGVYGSDPRIPGNSSLGAIPGMLRTLDPHSTFFSPQAFKQLREEQEGKYYGVGMVITARPGKMGKLMTVVVQPIPGSPAFRVGLRPGDLIVRVDGKPTEGLSTDKVAKMLKGPKGTIVHVTVSREGYKEALHFTITRAAISRPSVNDAFMIRPGIAYIHIASFNERTNDELAAALKRLHDQDLHGMILDLRNNPGGLLQEAVEVADHFLKKHQLIVYHMGRNSPEKKYYASKGEDGPEYPIVVLVNRFTASAAEIVTGALQDHDRALVMGEPSFGKGLVQTVYPLSDHTGLALTTARYYTPSGRLIQRNYSKISLYDYYYHPENTPPPHTEVRYTDGGRKVYGGGGITPDVWVKKQKPNVVEDTLSDHNVFFDFGKYYLGVHKTVPKDFEVTDAVLKEFKDFLSSHKIDLTDQQIKDNLDYIRNKIRVQLIGSIYGENEANKISVENDTLVKKALQDMPQAKELLVNVKEYMASKELK